MKLNPEDFKIRCSQIGKIMGGNVGLTEAQESYLAQLELRKHDPDQKPLTAKMESDLADLRHKKDNPELPAGAKTYCLKWLQNKLYGRQTFITAKQLKRGNMEEEKAIQFMASYLDLGYIQKNEVQYEDKYMTGTPDIVTNIVADTKVPWTFSTMPIFATECPEPDYYGQGQGYLSLTGKDEFWLVYVLVDMDDMQIDIEAERWARFEGVEYTKEIEDMFYYNMKYHDVPDHLKVKVFKFNRDQEYIDEVIRRVNMCREYIASIINSLPDVFKS